ncbi:MAG: prealbumin-like fold domain-containing protein [Clostridiales bacterium]|nr:prealbumin-like fold domain-containing protein [Clostridiales bacterium]
MTKVDGDSLTVDPETEQITATPLAGAEFALYREDQVTVDSTTGELTIKDYEEPCSTYTDKSEKTPGEFTIENLTTGYYYLMETKAPENFIKLDGYWCIYVDSSTETYTVLTDDHTEDGVTYAGSNNLAYDKYYLVEKTNNDGEPVLDENGYAVYEKIYIADEEESGPNDERIYYEYFLPNYRYYELPNTGGWKKYALPWVIAGCALVAVAVGLTVRRRRKVRKV